MLSDSQKEKITKFVEKCIAKNDTFHQMPHINETARLAVWLAKIEKGDRDVCWTSAMLHNICRSQPGDHGAEGSKKAAEFLLELGIDKEFVEKVKDAVFFHNKYFKDGSIERKILWDADKYQSIGVDNFNKRLLPAFIVYFGEKIGTQKAMDEYRLYEPIFRTETGRKEIKKHAKEINEYFAKLMAA
jgi:HD superfamily phosphodiesterase